MSGSDPASVAAGALTALLPEIIDLVKTALADDYDQEAEFQALAKIQYDLHAERVRRRIAEAGR